MRQLLLLFCLLFTSFPITQASAQESECSNLIDFWYDGSTLTLYFINPNNGDMLGTAAENVLNFVRHGFSPDCRYFGASLIRNDENTPVDCFGQFDGSRSADIRVWDSATGQVLGEYPDNHYAHSSVYWNPYGSQLVFTGCHGATLWDFVNNRHLAFIDHQPLGGDLRVQWSENPAEVYGLIYGYATGYYSEGIVYSANWQNFSPVFNYDNDRPGYENHREDCHLEHYKIDGQYLIIFCYSSWLNAAPITVWNRYSHQRLALLNAEHISTTSPNLIQLSPDGRYLVLTTTSLRVWELWDLPVDFAERSQDFQYQFAGLADSLTFINNITVEITMTDLSLIHMNILTGEILE